MTALSGEIFQKGDSFPLQAHAGRSGPLWLQAVVTILAFEDSHASGKIFSEPRIILRSYSAEKGLTP